MGTVSSFTAGNYLCKPRVINIIAVQLINDSFSFKTPRFTNIQVKGGHGNLSNTIATGEEDNYNVYHIYNVIEFLSDAETNFTSAR